MLKVEKRSPVRRRRLGPWVLAGLAVCLAITLAVLQKTEETTEATETRPALEESVLLVDRTEEDVKTIQVSLRGDAADGWLAQREADGILRVLGEDSFTVARYNANDILRSAAVVQAAFILTEDPAQWRPRLAEFGLDDPRVTATFTYTDGESLTVLIGNRGHDGEQPFYYMAIDGDDRLFGLDVGTEESLDVPRSLLRPVPALNLHKARIDQISVETPQQRLIWRLNGAITDADAADRWLLVEPVRYPADSERMDTMRTNLSNLLLGAWVAEATPENQAAYGMNSPRLKLSVHQSAGDLLSSETAGEVVSWPAGEVTLVLGGAKNDVVDWVMVDGQIYTMSHFSLTPFLSATALATLTRYPVLVSLSNLLCLTVTQGDRVTRWDVAIADSSNEQETTEVTRTVTRNGEPALWAGFELAYNELLMATVSGELPTGWQPAGEPEIQYAFSTRTGVTHTIALYPFDAMHDAVEVDGSCMFYIIHDGLAFDPPFQAQQGSPH